jgi:hypothetical protein
MPFYISNSQQLRNVHVKGLVPLRKADHLLAATPTKQWHSLVSNDDRNARFQNLNGQQNYMSHFFLFLRSLDGMNGIIRL